uniref:Uncharacterized protein n=1 Tax=Heterorhabditis bacteriophora TaxID=37862 RepID=A0A1I7WZJ1_HETBA
MQMANRLIRELLNPVLCPPIAGLSYLSLPNTHLCLFFQLFPLFQYEMLSSLSMSLNYTEICLIFNNYMSKIDVTIFQFQLLFRHLCISTILDHLRVERASGQILGFTMSNSQFIYHQSQSHQIALCLPASLGFTNAASEDQLKGQGEQF